MNERLFTYYWGGETAIFTIGNKQQHNTGIDGAYLVSHSGVFTDGRLANLTNTGAGNVEPTVGSLTLVEQPSERFMQVEANAYVTWKSGGRTDAHYVASVVNCRKATGIEFGPTHNFYSDEVNKIVGATLICNGASNSGFYNNSTAKLNITTIGLSNDVITTVGSEQFNVHSNFVSVADGLFTNSGVFVAGLDATSMSGRPTDDFAASNQVLHNTSASAVVIKNATKEIKLNDSTADTSIYIAAGQSREISYTVIPEYAGVAYSYELAFVETPNVSSVTFETVAPTKDAVGKFTFNANNEAAGTSTTLKMKSVASANGDVLSPVVTIYITAANTEIFINVGDIYTMVVIDGDDIKEGPDTAVASAEVIGTGADRKLVITAANVAGNTAKTSVTMTSGTVITVNVAHLSVSIA